MKKETLDLLKDYLDDDLKDILYGDAEKAKERLAEKTDDEWLADAEEKYESRLIPLFRAMKKADEKPSDSAEDEVTDQAIRAHEFTGLFARGLLRKSSKMMSIGDVFKLHYIARMASFQMENIKERTDHRVAGKTPGLLRDMERVIDPLLDPQYKAAYIEHQAELIEATQKTFDQAESQLFKLGKKASSRSGFGVLLALIIWIVGGLFIWNTFGHVWNWAYDFIDRVFFPLILFFWVIPILYAVIIGFLFLWVGTEISELSCKSSDKKLKEKIAELKSDAAFSVRNTEAAKNVDAFDQDLPSAFRSYTGHMALAAVAAITGEKSVAQIARRAQDGSTWFTRRYKKRSIDAKPYDAAIASLLYDKIPDETDVFAAYTLMCEQNEDGYGGSFRSDFYANYIDAEKENLSIRGKLIYCFVNYCLEALKEGEKNGRKRPGFAALLEEFHKGNYYMKVDNDNYSRIHTQIRGNNALIDWHLGRKP